MNIFRISRAFFPVIDGAAQHVWGLSRAQANTGHRVHLYQPHVPTWNGIPDSMTIKRVNLGRLGPMVYGSKAIVALFGTFAGYALWRRAGRLAIDVVHVHGDAVDAAAVGVWARQTGVPLVITVHGSLNTGSRYRRWAPRMFRFVDRFIVVSEAVQSQLIDLGVAGEKIHVISSGIDVKRFTVPARRTLRPVSPHSPLRVVSVGRLHPVKGFGYLIRAARLLAEQAVPIHITIVGSGPDEAALQQQAAGIGNVSLIGQRDSDEIGLLLGDSDVFVLPSINMGVQAEGAPTAVFEAMAAGLPIVCTNTGGLPRIVQHGVHGVVVEERNAAELASALRMLAETPSQRASMGAHNVEVAKSKDWSVISTSVERVYREAMSNSRYIALPSRA